MKSALSSDYFRDSAVAMAANFLCQLYLCGCATDAAEAEMEVVSNPVQPIKDFQKKTTNFSDDAADMKSNGTDFTQALPQQPDGL